MLTDTEKKQLIFALLNAKGRVDQADIDKAYAWATDIRLKQGILENVLIGNVCLTINGDQVLVELSPEGKIEAERIVASVEGTAR